MKRSFELNCALDSDAYILLFCAFRYALGRRTYVVSSVVDTIINNWENLATSQRYMFKKEIREAEMANDVGSTYDDQEWRRILNLED